MKHKKKKKKMIQLSSAAASETFFNHRDQLKNTFFCRQQRRDKDKVKQDLNENALDKKVFYLAFRSYSEATKEEMEVWEKNLLKIM